MWIRATDRCRGLASSLSSRESGGRARPAHLPNGGSTRGTESVDGGSPSLARGDRDGESFGRRIRIVWRARAPLSASFLSSSSSFADDDEREREGAMVTTMPPGAAALCAEKSAYRDVRQRGRLDTRRFSLHATRFCPVRRNPGGIKLHGDQNILFVWSYFFLTIKFFVVVVDGRRRGVLVRFCMTFLDPGRENGKKVHERYFFFNIIIIIVFKTVVVLLGDLATRRPCFLDGRKTVSASFRRVFRSPRLESRSEPAVLRSASRPSLQVSGSPSISLVKIVHLSITFFYTGGPMSE